MVGSPETRAIDEGQGQKDKLSRLAEWNPVSIFEGYFSLSGKLRPAPKDTKSFPGGYPCGGVVCLVGCGIYNLPRKLTSP